MALLYYRKYRLYILLKIKPEIIDYTLIDYSYLIKFLNVVSQGIDKKKL